MIPKKGDRYYADFSNRVYDIIEEISTDNALSEKTLGELVYKKICDVDTAMKELLETLYDEGFIDARVRESFFLSQ